MAEKTDWKGIGEAISRLGVALTILPIAALLLICVFLCIWAALQS